VLDAKRGLIVTNFHVVNGASDFEAVVDGAERDAKVLGAAPCDDLAVLQVEDREGLTRSSRARTSSPSATRPARARGRTSPRRAGSSPSRVARCGRRRRTRRTSPT
jgi:S1-C subfamily serine protease